MRLIGSTRRHRPCLARHSRIYLATIFASSGLVLAALSSAPSAGAATLTVTNCNSSGSGSLANVVAGAAANSTITFSVTCSTITVTQTIDLSVPLTIEGPGANTLDVDGPQNPQENADLFEVAKNVAVSISDLSITNEDVGFENKGTLTCTDCSLDNDSGQANTTMIENDGTLTLEDSGLSGGGPFAQDGADMGLLNNGTATLDNSGASGFATHGSSGPSAIENEGQLTISSSAVSGNDAYLGGGTLLNDGGTVDITGSQFMYNQSGNGDGSGGESIFNTDGTVNISDSTIEDNYPEAVDNDDTMTITGSTIESNQGGGINSGGNLTVTDSTVSKNAGGGINFSDGTATITGSTISNNTVTGKNDGGGINNGQDGAMTIVDTTVTGNNANDGTGGGIYNDGTLSLDDSTVASNKDSAGGGGIDNANTLTVADSTISKNTLVDAGGAGGGGILNQPPGKKAVPPSLVLTASTLAGNLSDGRGGGIENHGGTAAITSSTLAQNTSKKQGGGIDTTAGGSTSLAATAVAESSPQDCSGAMTDAGYNLDDDGSCGLSSASNSDSDVDPYLGPLQDNGGPTKTEEPAHGSPLLGVIPTGASANGVTLCPGTDQRGVTRPQASACDIGAVELSPTAQDLTSPNGATATAGQPFSFGVTTTGSPTPKLSETGKLPKKLAFTDNGDGTATISGKAKKAGTSQLLIQAKFGKYVVLQVFTLTVTAG